VPKLALRSSLKKLQAQLMGPTEFDDETRELLREVADDIESVLSEGGPTPNSLQQRLDKAVVRFEASHPQLAHTLGELTDALARLGV
jgi:hypothetical protein